MTINNDNGRNGGRNGYLSQTSDSFSDAYYARQYGLYPYGGRTRCCGGTNYDYD